MLLGIVFAPSTHQCCKWKIIKQVCKDFPNISIAIPANKHQGYLFFLYIPVSKQFYTTI